MAGDSKMEAKRYGMLPVHRPMSAVLEALGDSVILQPTEGRESLSKSVGRAKARWLSRIMYDGDVPAFHRCVAYAIADYLNCVTRDCWPSKELLMSRLGRDCAESIQRAVRFLQRRGYLEVREVCGLQRYAPVFIASDWDKNVGKPRQKRRAHADKIVGESSLCIHPKKSCSTPPTTTSESTEQAGGKPFKRAERGAIETRLAELLGRDGIEILSRIAWVSEDALDDLCQAYVDGLVGPRELEAARLAAAHVNLGGRRL